MIKNKLLLLVVMAITLLCGCSANSLESSSKENSMQDDKSNAQNEEDLYEAESALESADSICHYIALQPHNYEEVLFQYKKASQNNYYEEYSGDYNEWKKQIGNYVALEYANNHNEDIYYSLYDVDQNGVDELLVAALWDGEPHYYDILSFDGEKPYHLFNMDFGYRVNLDIYTDGTLEVKLSNSAFEYICDFYEISSDGTCHNLKSLIRTGTMEKDEVTMQYLKIEGDITTKLTKDEYTEQLTIEQNEDKPNIEWVLMEL